MSQTIEPDIGRSNNNKIFTKISTVDGRKFYFIPFPYPYFLYNLMRFFKIESRLISDSSNTEIIYLNVKTL